MRTSHWVGLLAAVLGLWGAATWVHWRSTVLSLLRAILRELRGTPQESTSGPPTAAGDAQEAEPDTGDPAE